MRHKPRTDPEEGSAEPLLDNPQEIELDDMDLKDKNKDSDSLENAFSRDGNASRSSEESQDSFSDRHAILREDTLSVFELIKAYPWALGWSLLVSMTVIMEGYDLMLVGNFMAFPTFQKKYGRYYADIDQWQVSAPWMAGLQNAAGVGSFFGSFLSGWLVQIFGKKRVLLSSLVALSAFVSLTFFAVNAAMLLVGEALCGIPWGIFATISPAYASEVLPRKLRVYLTSYTNMCFVIGQLIASGVLAGLVHIDSEWSYRIPFALQWVWPAFLIPTLFFAPESPYHLVQTDQCDKAGLVLKRLVRESANIDTEATLRDIIHTNDVEKQLSAGTSFLDCFRGTERRRTIIACVMFSGQCLSGSSFAYNSTYFFEQVGLEKQLIYDINLGGIGLALIGCFASWFVVIPYFGRRTIYLWGLAIMASILLLIGILSARGSEYAFGIAQTALTLLWTFFYQLTVGQLGWAIPAEIGSTRLRQKTVCLARNAYYIISVASNVIEPFAMNPTQWNLKGETSFIWFGTAFLTLIWGYFYFPETQGRSDLEIDLMFAAKLPARKFKGYQVSVDK
ncbi:maltose permease MAL31 [Leptodontidium sp. MPI-SDFR-AT-0119]|nr:maltose permease MAL31 [Leptodontidium sp. MPI-SDFR-AT-0119]